MKNNFFLKYQFSNIYKKPSRFSEVTSQMLYGEKFKILSKNKNWVKIKTYFDNYIGYIINKNYVNNFKPTHKVFILKARVYNNGVDKKNFLPFGSKISIIRHNRNFLEFEKNKWIKKKDLKKIDHIEKNYNKIFKLFLNSKYLWGGKTAKGIDCSSLIQIYFFYNQFFFPRDTKDQIKFCNKKKRRNYSKGDIIFWKGHVGICLDKSKFIHAYGPKKKVIIMSVNYAVKLIERTAKLLIKKVSNVENY